MTSTSEDFLIGALIGGAIGAAAALMLTPLSGETLRRRIAHGINMMPNGSTPKPRSVAKEHSRTTTPHKPKSAPTHSPRKSQTPVKGRRKPSVEE